MSTPQPDFQLAAASRRRWYPVAGGILLLALLLAWWLWPRTAKVQYNTVRADRGDIVLRVTASGSLSATVTVDVGSQVTGRIQDLYVDYNSVVKKGQIIARIDPALYAAQAAQARANVTAARGNLAKSKAQAADAHRQADRARELAAQKLLAQSDADTARANAEVADAGVLQAQGQLQQAQAAQTQSETNLRYTDIISPTDGVVISRAVSQGQTVSASLSAPVLFTIAQDLRAMEVHAAVSEADIGRLTPGLPASFTVDAYPGEPFSGTIREIRNAATITSNIVTYDTVIDVANSDLKLKPSMTANVTFVVARRDKALRIPNAALRFKPGAEMLAALQAERGESGQTPRAPAAAAANGQNKRVWILQDGKARPVRVQLGLSDGSFTEISGGDLQEGAELITGTGGASSNGNGNGSSNSQRRMPMGPL